MNANLFANFIYELLRSIREDPERSRRPIVLFIDNARIHSPQMVLDVVLGMRVVLLYNAQYSPQLNPIEKFFNVLKKEVARRELHGR